MTNLETKVYNYPTKYKEGFVYSEIEELLKGYPNINRDKFFDALMGITAVVKDEQTVIYRTDIYKALLCGIEKRDLRNYEWD